MRSVSRSPTSRSPRRICVSCLTVLLLVVTGCTGTTEPAPDGVVTPSSDGAPSVIEPRGSVVAGFVGAPATLDPYSPRASDLTRILIRPLVPSLFKLLPDGTTEPWLAESLTEIDGGVRVTLRELSWSDGSAVTARDVVLSIGRARRSGQPTGFAAVRRARRIGASEIELLGAPEDWAGALATAAYILPGGRWDPQKTAGILEIADYTPNLELTLVPAPGSAVAFRKVRLQFFDDLIRLIDSLKSGDVDVASLPSTVNLSSRLEEADLKFSSVIGWEWVGVRAVEPGAAGTVAGVLDLGALQEGFIRGDGSITAKRWPSPDGAAGPKDPFSYSGGAPLTLAIPVGDELLALMQRAVQLQAESGGVEMQLAQIEAARLYGSWQRQAPVEALLMRSLGAPYLSTEPPSAGPKVPMFRVATCLAWGEGIEGVQVNPTVEGPLWNVEDWRRAAGSKR